MGLQVDRRPRSSLRPEPCSPGRVGWPEHHMMRIASGQIMAQTIASKLLSCRAAGALVLGTALMFSPPLLESASAQALGYASHAPMSFPSDNVMVQPEDDGDDSATVMPERLKRTIVAFDTPRSAGHDRDRYRQHLPLLRARPGSRDSLRRRRRSRRLHLVRRADRHAQGRMAGLDSASRDDRAPALSAALRRRRPRQSARRARHVSRLQHLSHSRHQRSVDHRQVRLLRLHPPDQ